MFTCITAITNARFRYFLVYLTHVSNYSVGETKTVVALVVVVVVYLMPTLSPLQVEEIF